MARVSSRALTRIALALLLVAASASATQPPVRTGISTDGAAGPCAAGDDTPAYVPRLLQVTVNEVNTRQEYLFLQRRCGALLVRPGDLEALRIRTAGKPMVEVNGEKYLNLNAFEGLSYRLNEAGQSLVLEGEPGIFYPTVINFEHDRLPRSGPPAPGAFLNYGLFLSDLLEGGARVTTGSATLGLFDWFNSKGVLVSDWIGLRQAQTQTVTRLATTFTRDFPVRTATLRVGDVNSRGGSFGGSAAVGGVQYATNFGTRPFLITTPVEMMAAATNRSSVLDLFTSELDAPERQSRANFLSGLANAPYGPVEVINIPTYQNGEYHLVLRDRLGREYSVRQPFYFNQGLLRQGLHDFSYEAGARRQNFSADDYGDAFGSATHRYGFNARFTGEGHLEVSEDGQALGGGGAYVLPYAGVLAGTLAGSSATAVGEGVYGALGLENRYHDFGYAARMDCQSREFVLPSSGVNSGVICRSFASVSSALPWDDSLSLSLSQARFRTAPETRSLQLGYSSRALRGVTLSAFASYTDRPAADYTVGLLASLSLASLQELAGRDSGSIRSESGSLLDPRRVRLSLTANTGRDRDLLAQARISSGARIGEQDIGVQYTEALAGRDARTLSGLWSNRYVGATAGLSQFDGVELYSAGASSGLVWLDGGLFPTRPVTSSFALVRLGEEHAGVRVNGYRSDGDGDVLLTPLQPYLDNPVGINGADLPMNAKFDALSFALSPRFRSGVVARPKIEVLRDAIITVQLRSRENQLVPLPPGAYATLPGSDELFPTGEDGAVYLLGLEPTTPVTITWNEQSCEIQVVLPGPVTGDSIPELGPYVCEGVRP